MRAATETMRDEARRMVVTMVEMERSYLTAEVFKEILSQNGRSPEMGPEGLIRTLSGALPDTCCPASLSCCCCTSSIWTAEMVPWQE